VTCRHCGTEIAANALICYRCGHATADERAPAQGGSRRARTSGGAGPWVTGAAALVLVAAALYMGQATYGQVPRALPWTLAGLAALVLAWRLWRRGRT
jgi:predicted cobalt transporter CbtA